MRSARNNRRGFGMPALPALAHEQGGRQARETARHGHGGRFPPSKPPNPRWRSGQPTPTYESADQSVVQREAQGLPAAPSKGAPGLHGRRLPRRAGRPGPRAPSPSIGPFLLVFRRRRVPTGLGGGRRRRRRAPLDQRRPAAAGFLLFTLCLPVGHNATLQWRPDVAAAAAANFTRTCSTAASPGACRSKPPGAGSRSLIGYHGPRLKEGIGWSAGARTPLVGFPYADGGRSRPSE